MTQPLLHDIWRVISVKTTARNVLRIQLLTRKPFHSSCLVTVTCVVLYHSAWVDCIFLSPILSFSRPWFFSYAPSPPITSLRWLLGTMFCFSKRILIFMTDCNLMRLSLTRVCHHVKICSLGFDDLTPEKGVVSRRLFLTR